MAVNFKETGTMQSNGGGKTHTKTYTKGNISLRIDQLSVRQTHHRRNPKDTEGFAIRCYIFSRQDTDVLTCAYASACVRSRLYKRGATLPQAQGDACTSVNRSSFGILRGIKEEQAIRPAPSLSNSFFFSTKIINCYPMDSTLHRSRYSPRISLFLNRLP